MDISKDAIRTSITKFNKKMFDLLHKFEWPSGLCKKCHPNNPSLYYWSYWKMGIHSRCLIPTGGINFPRIDYINGKHYLRCNSI